jgi:L-alanine-DL-glutamate epimerase-like enolase superfamily enzyme
MRCSAVARANNLQVSAHCAPALHVPIAAATTNLRHLEYFADHVRLEPLLFDGIPVARGGVLTANESPGHGYRVGSGAREYRI